MSAHRRDSDKGEFVSYIVKHCPSKVVARQVEQAVLSACIVGKIFKMDTERIGTGSNKIRGIAKNKLNDLKGNLSDLLSLMSCTAESDMLDLMGI